MKRGTILALLGCGILVLFGLYGWLTWRSNQEESAQQEETEQTLWLYQGEVCEIAYTYQGETIELLKMDDTWYYPKDGEFPLDQSAASALANETCAIEASRKFTATDAQMETFGLAAPRIVLTLTDEDNQTVTLYLGNANPTTQEVYACVDGEQEVYMIDGQLADFLSQGLDFLQQAEYNEDNTTAEA